MCQEQISYLPIPSVSLINDRPATTSLNVAEHFEKPHKNVLADIRNLLADCPTDFNGLNFQPVEYTDAKGEKRPMFTIYFDGFILLVMGYTGKKALAMKLAYIEAFNAMREELEAKNRIEPHSPESVLTPDQQCTLQTIVRSLVTSNAPDANKGRYMGLFSQIWSRFNNHFRLGSYKQLPQGKMGEAIEYLMKLEIRKPALVAGKASAENGKGQDSASKTGYRLALDRDAAFSEQPLAGEYQKYLLEVEHWRVANKAQFNLLLEKGAKLVDISNVGSALYEAYVQLLKSWIETMMLSDQTAQPRMFTGNPAPARMAAQLNALFGVVRK